MKDKKIDGYIQIPKFDYDDTDKLDTIKFEESLNNLSKSVSTVAQALVNAHKSIISEIDLEKIGGISKVLSNFANETLKQHREIRNIIASSFSINLNGVLRKIVDSLPNLKLSDLSGYDSEYLKKNYWVIPFEYELKDINSLTSLTKKEFNKEMIKHFDNQRVKRLFKSCIDKETNKEKQIILKQIRTNYFMGNYATCLTCLITYFDGLTLQLIDDSSKFQHLSHRAINSLKNYYYDEVPFENKGYETYLKLDILNNFYDVLYNNVYDLKKPTSNNLNRNLNSHGVRYSNKPIDTLRILNAIWFVQTIIDETNMKENFTIDNKRNANIKKK